MNEQRVREVALVLAEGFPVVPEDDHERVVVDLPLAQPAQELPQRGVPFVQGIHVAREVVVSGNGPAAFDAYG